MSLGNELNPSNLPVGGTIHYLSHCERKSQETEERHSDKKLPSGINREVRTKNNEECKRNLSTAFNSSANFVADHNPTPEKRKIKVITSESKIQEDYADRLQQVISLQHDKIFASRTGKIDKKLLDIYNNFKACSVPTHLENMRHSLENKEVNLNLAFGRFQIDRLKAVFATLDKLSCEINFPKKIIGIGSGEAFIEKAFHLMKGIEEVKCYDQKSKRDFNCLPITHAKFPRDIDRCLPANCADTMLVCGYPRGILGPVLSTFLKRGGERLCTTVCKGIFATDWHLRFEKDQNLLIKSIEEINKKEDTSFEVRLCDCDNAMSDEYSYIQFYNFPDQVKEALEENGVLSGLVGEPCLFIDDDTEYDHCVELYPEPSDSDSEFNINMQEDGTPV